MGKQLMIIGKEAKERKHGFKSEFVDVMTDVWQ